MFLEKDRYITIKIICSNDIPVQNANSIYHESCCLSKLGEPGYIPPDNGPGGKIAAIAGLAALAYDNRQQYPEFPQINQEQNSGVLIFTNINAEQRKEKKGK